MPAREANARWEGSLQEGKGTLRLGSGAFEGQYAFTSRFEDGTGTNPEELIGAALAGCFSMALAAGLGRAGFTSNSVESDAKVHLEKGDAGFSISRIELTTTADVTGIDEATFQEHVESTRTGCIVARALGGVDIQVKASLNG